MEISHPGHESDTSCFDGVATPNTLSNCTLEPMFVPLAKLNGIIRSKLCELQAEDNSLKVYKNLLNITKKTVFSKIVCFTITDNGVKKSYCNP